MEYPAQYKVSMLGEFSISRGSKTVCDKINRSKKSWNLLEYLLVYRDRSVPQDELVELLWSDETSYNPSGALKVLLHRVRRSLEDIKPENGEELIILKRGAYSWNPSLSCITDTSLFEEACTLASDGTLPADQRLQHYAQAFKLYKGHFLSRNSNAPWVVPIASYYHTMYIRSVYAAIELLEAESCFTDIERLARHAIKLDPTEERLHYHLIQALYKSGKQHEALSQYSDTTDSFYKKFGITPSDELRSLYKLIVKTTKSLETDLSIIKDALKEKGEATGAFFCEYEFFKDIYQLQARSLSRNGDSIYICLVTLNKHDGSLPEMKTLNKSMDDLRITIKETLRRGDIVARYSISQYVLLLPATTYESVETVMMRITSSFYRRYVKKNITLQYKLQPLEPLMDL